MMLSYPSPGWSAGFSTDSTQNMANGVAAGLSALGSVNKSDNSTTYSAIGPTIYLTVNQGEAPTGLSRDTQNANAKTERFDMTEVRERQEMAQVIGEIANNSVAIALKPRLDKAEQDKKEAQHRLETDPNDAVAKAQLAQANAVIAHYGQGSDIQMAVRAVTGVLQGIATGNVGQAVVGGLSPYVNQLIKEVTTDQSTGKVNREANLMAHALLGAVEAYAIGNHVGAGAAGVLAGVPAVLYEAVSDIASVVLSPMETIDALSTFVSQDDMFDSVAEGIKQDYLARLEHFRQEYERAGAGGSFNAGVEVGKLVTEAASMAMGGAGITKTSATALSKGISNSVQIGMHQVHRVTNWNAVRHVVDTSQVAEATSNGFINAQKVRDLAYVLKPTNELEKKLLDDIVSSGDLTGSKTEQLFNSLAERSGYKVLDGGKYRANNGFDHVWQAKDGSIVIVDSKQLRNGALQVSTKGAGGTNQLSKGWIEAVTQNLPTEGDVAKAMKIVKNEGLPVKTIIVAVDKSDKTVKIIPVKIPNKSK
ncbi:hypothetical protein [Pelistega suis]|uniref:Uncharacterized protein n=1 Tax=Pelistega suis TaxID=1631957 RepID=A0A849P7M6_9BURK|nr:hypothetical protein [Pelistega suis]NOL52581.1 hypothetical protein [Pelistega suis]